MKLVDHRVYDIGGPFAAGHCVVQDRPKTIGRKLRLREALARQIIIESKALLVWHGGLRNHGDVSVKCASAEFLCSLCTGRERLLVN
jgi:hypothetical protein